MVDQRIIDGDERATGEFWIIVCTETKVLDHQSAPALTTVYRATYDTEREACDEALSLAGKYKGYAFAVLKSQAIAKWKCSQTKCCEWPDTCRRACPKSGVLRWQECEPEPRRRLPTEQP